ncbi:UNVERIFIED_CONTAM: protein LIFEGUARD 2 [Sesamum radiatum]|uniref:Protein LIFEGUARD 2 n=1 Tax=Sesamum radiatum TaxID=300843 RepID=A0AAW2W2T0_SESRA
MSNQKNDVEAEPPLVSVMQESPELRWAFIRKVYSILTVQLLVNYCFWSPCCGCPSHCYILCHHQDGLAVYVVIVLIPTIVLCPLYFCRNKHPLKFVLLGIFTLCYGFALGVVCAFISGKVVIETVMATTVVVISLTLYTFWAAKRGQDFGFLAPFLLSILVILLLFSIFQIFFPMGKISQTIYSALTVIIFCAYIIYDTDNLIKRTHTTIISGHPLPCI